MKLNEALTALKYNREKSFALVGTEPFLKDHFIKTAAAIKRDYEYLDVSPDNQQEALDIIGCNNFIKHLIVLRCFNEMNLSKFEKMENFDGCLIFVIEEKADIKSRHITNILSHATIVECNKLREYGLDYPTWIMSNIMEAGYRAQEGVDSLIFSMVGPNMYALSNELEKLYLIKSDKTITLNDVEKYVSNTAISTFFELFENLLKKNIKKALTNFEAIYRTQDNYIELTGFLGTYLEKMYRILLLHENKMDPKDIAEIVGLPLFILKTKYLSRVLSLGRFFIGSKIDQLCHVDAQLRLFKGDKKILMEKFIMSFFI